jgi:hypothetical protein
MYMILVGKHEGTRYDIKPTLKKQDERAWGRFHVACVSEWEQVAGSYTHCNKTSRSIKRGKCLQWLRIC